jgi:hypothetical protein
MAGMMNPALSKAMGLLMMATGAMGMMKGGKPKSKKYLAD